MEYTEVTRREVPLQLLLEGDPSERSIETYLNDFWCFAAKRNSQILGACIAKSIGERIAEIFNISVYPAFQQQGIGSDILHYVLSELAEKQISRVELGTGTFGYQLTYYQRFSFRVNSVIKDHFLVNYPDPIYENGIQHKDMLRLYVELEPRT